MKPASLNFFTIALAFLGFAGVLSPAGLANPAATAPKAETALSFTNAVPVAVFKVMDPFTARDPFCPIGYQKPRPLPPEKEREKKIAEVEIKLNLKGIMLMTGGESLATLNSGEVLAVGEMHTYKDPAFKDAVIEYKVLQITEDSVVVSYNGKEFTSRLAELDLNRFKEKEEPNEKPKP